jgi:hypothetical protein
MTHYVVDTNVAVVANGRDGDYNIDCRLACVEQIRSISQHARHRTILDNSGAILEEYRVYLNPHGQPGVGDEFYRFLLNFQGNSKRVLQVDLQKNPETGAYRDFPNSPSLAGFDEADKKFAAAARVGRGIVVNAVDPDWKEFAAPLREEGIKVKELCPACLP